MKKSVFLVIFVVVVSFLSIVGCAQVQSDTEKKSPSKLFQLKLLRNV